MQSWMVLEGPLEQVETIAALQVVGADQKLVGIVLCLGQIVQSEHLIGDGTGDPRRALIDVVEPIWRVVRRSIAELTL
jgi:hypothetical protein